MEKQNKTAEYDSADCGDSGELMNIRNFGAESSERNGIIIRTSIIGIASNLLLAAFKAAIGIIANSVSVVLDAVNNVSDAASSIITIIGTKLAGKSPDREHPFGHGRAEYISSMVISALVLYAGITSLVESVKKIIKPETPDYSFLSLVIIAVAVAVKIFLGLYVSSKGRKAKSDSLENSGRDALNDSIISGATLAAALIYTVWNISLESYLAAVISIVIIKSGIDMIKDTFSKILGERADAELAQEIKNTVCGFDGVTGAYDLILNNYGPDKFNGSIHIEIPDTYTADEIDELLRQITVKVYQKHNVILTAIGVYSLNTKDKKAIEMREKIKDELTKEEYVLQMHGFYVNETSKTIRFDLIISFDAPDRLAVYETAVKKAQSLYPDYKFEITLDSDFSEPEHVKEKGTKKKKR